MASTHPRDEEKGRHTDGSDHSTTFIETLEKAAPGYGKERSTAVADDIIVHESENPNVYQKMCLPLFVNLTAMSFLWVGSQIPLYMFGGVFPLIYNDIGGYYIYIWLIIGYLIPNAALCPFVGALSDLIGRKWVAAAGQIMLVVGPIVTATAEQMRVAIGMLAFPGHQVKRTQG